MTRSSAASPLAAVLLFLAVAACGADGPSADSAEGDHRRRIRAYDDAAGLNAITVLNPDAAARADSLDAVRERGGDTGPLHCVPTLVKDNMDTGDMVTTGGSAALAESVPPDDATIVRRMREAGAVVVAKTNMARP